MLALDVEEAVFVDWELEHGRMIVRRWSTGTGLVETTRAYP